VVDVSDPQAPLIMAQDGEPTSDVDRASVAISGDTVYWADGTNTVKSIDNALAAPRNNIILEQAVNSIEKAGTQLLLVTQSGQIEVYEAIELGLQPPLAVVSSPRPAASVFISGTTGIILTRQVLDCAIPPGCSVVSDPEVVLFWLGE
jgi:hypothetical protein